MNDTYPILEGDKFSEKITTGKISGIGLKIALDEKYKEEYESLVQTGDLVSLPIEYYDVEWYSFARKALTSRSIPVKSSFIDVGFSKFQNGSDVYISRIVQNILETEEKTKVAQAYRKVKETFSRDKSITDINAKITDISKLSDKKIELTVDLGSNSTWDGSLITQLDNIPFDFIGKGEQAVVKTDLALSNKKSEASSVILIEEPECYISHTRLNQLLKSIKENYADKQIIISTHSSFVSNKLGLDNLILLNRKNTTRFDELEAKEFFEKIAGYDTLRLILCKKAILVEGDSDELVIQRAYMDNHEGRVPIEDGVEIISVGTSFLRYLEIAEHLDLPVRAITDNDGDLDALKRKYANYLDANQKENIENCYDENKYICDFANRLFPEYPQCESLQIETTVYDGVFLVKEKDIDKYLGEYTPLQLRYDRKTKKINPYYEVKNYGESKGATYGRVLIYPTKKMMDWILCDNKIDNIKTDVLPIY